MLNAVGLFTVFAIMIAVAAVVLTNSAEAIARLTRLGHMLVGSVLLAAATSLPELTVDLNAIYLDLPDMAVGGLIGSSLFNLLILAIADLTHHQRGAMFSRTAVAHALAATVSIGLTAVVGIAIFVERKLDLGTLEIVGLGLGSISVLISYLFGMRIIFFDQQVAKEKEEKIFESKEENTRRQLIRACIGFVAATAVIFFTAPYLAKNAETIAILSGWGETFVGSTLVALSTSLPELVASITAVRIGAIDMAIGNIFGSNAFNMLLIVPLDLAYGGSLLAVASDTHILTCFAVVTVTSVVILGHLYRSETRKFLIEPDAALVIGMTVGSLWLIYLCR